MHLKPSERPTFHLLIQQLQQPIQQSKNIPAFQVEIPRATWNVSSGSEELNMNERKFFFFFFWPGFLFWIVFWLVMILKAFSEKNLQLLLPSSDSIEE